MLDAELQRLAALYERLRLELLDITRRNRMLNYPMGARSKRHLQIVDKILDHTYGRLVGDEASFKLTALPQPDAIPADEKTEEFIAALRQAETTDVNYLTMVEGLEAQGRDDEHELAMLELELREKVRVQLELPPRPTTADINRAEHARTLGIDASFALPEKASKPSHSDQDLQTVKFPNELEAIVEKIADDARLAEQEMGVSTLFLAFGFLEWYDKGLPDKKALAPLLLLSVKLRIERSKGQTTYHLLPNESTAETNLSLRKLLQADFNRTLPDFDPEDDGPAPIERYLAAVRSAIDGLERWKVHRWLVLGHFAFGRFAMYEDLDPEKWAQHPAAHTLVSSILRGTEITDGNALLPSIPADYEIDEPEIEKIAPLLIHDADASQHSALIDVMRQKNLVIQGPPGTGKSQTITNIIANALAAGKTVLFLAEKQAALDVVRRRLAAADLGDFCLELHSDRSSPKLVVEGLRQRAAIPEIITKKAPGPDVGWYESRREISTYLDALHDEQPDGQTPFQCVWKSLRGRTVHSDVIDAFRATPLPDALLTDAEKRDITLSDLEIFTVASASFSASFGHPASSPWASVTIGAVTSRDIPTLIEALGRLKAIGTEIGDLLDQEGGPGLATIEDVARLVEVDGALGEPEAPDLIARIAAIDIGHLVRYLASMGEWHRITGALTVRPDLSSHPADLLALASKFIDGGLPLHLTGKTPAQLYDHAETAIAENEAVLVMIERLLPSLRLFDLRDQVPASALLPLAVAIRAGATVPPRSRTWLNTYREIEPARFWDLYKRWKSLADGEAQWRKHLIAYGIMPWPTPEELEAAAATLRKSGLAKAIATLNGASKASYALLESLGMEPSLTTARDLTALAQHIRALVDFEQNDAVAVKMLGTTWSGLSTPFGEIAEGIKLRELLVAHIGPLDQGMDIVDRLLRLEPRLFSRLTEDRFVRPAVDFCNLPDEIRARFDGRPISQVVSATRAEMKAMEDLLALDPSRLLTELDMPVRDIAEVATLMTERDEVQRAVDASPVKNAAAELATTPADISRAFAAISWIRTVTDANLPEPMRERLMSADAGAERERMHTAAQRGTELRNRYRAAIAQVAADFGLAGFDHMEPKELAQRADDLAQHGDELSDYLALRRHKTTLIDGGLEPFLAKADEIRLAPERLADVFITLVSDRLALKLFADPVFTKNSGLTLDARRKQFADRDRKKLGNDRAHVRRVLLARQPLAGSMQGPRGTWTEMAMLTHEFSKQRRHSPVRALLTRAGKSIQALKPCFMMSPLSLAKFAGPDALQFDLLVIDEASQMKPEDALGGMLRAAQVVVVGDPKQLPPSDFFSRSNEATIADVEFEDIDDESILEGCQKAFREVRRLKWHYRSRCESLIRFSNDTFYRDSPLITFPVAKPGSFSIDLIRVDGVYEARRNVREARRIAAAAAQFMRQVSATDEATIPTLGIVAVNAPQAELIHEELNRLSAGDTAIETYCEKVANKGEMLFVKNLENVQGDERDFILISLTYGRIPGIAALRQSFGPINGKQGHRRLNVLFTRARMRIGLFASFGSVDVTPTGQSSEGVHVLKQYLEYAERRGAAPVDAIGGTPDSDFENEVAERLRARGYEVEIQVGVSGYRIDLGIRHPDHPERFLAGIECDGASYHASKSARDRDRLREEVLRSLGWTIVRVWSTDWFDNPVRETSRLVKALEALREQPVTEMLSYPPVTEWAPDDLADAPVVGPPVPIKPMPLPPETPVQVGESTADVGMTDEAAGAATEPAPTTADGEPVAGPSKHEPDAAPAAIAIADIISREPIRSSTAAVHVGELIEASTDEASSDGASSDDDKASTSASDDAATTVTGPLVFDAAHVDAPSDSDTAAIETMVSTDAIEPVAREPSPIVDTADAGSSDNDDGVRTFVGGMPDDTSATSAADTSPTSAIGQDAMSGLHDDANTESAESTALPNSDMDVGHTDTSATDIPLADAMANDADRSNADRGSDHRDDETLPADESHSALDSASAGDGFRLEPTAIRPQSTQHHLPFGFAAMPATNGGGEPTEFETHEQQPEPDSMPIYAQADLVARGFLPAPERFFDEDYRETLRAMVDAVISTEGPIYEDVLVERVAKAHGFERIGGRIYTVVTDLVSRKIRRSRDEGRGVLWPEGERANGPVQYRTSPADAPDARTHGDVPAAELAGLAIRMIRPDTDDEDVLQRMADHFQIERLREPTRGRFERALTMARASLTEQSADGRGESRPGPTARSAADIVGV